MAEKKQILMEKALKANLGTEKFLDGVSTENLEKMVSAIEERDGEIDILKKKKAAPVKDRNVTTVADLVRKKKISNQMYVFTNLTFRHSLNRGSGEREVRVKRQTG